MGLGCTGFIAKVLLFVINFAVFVCGAVLLGVGIALVIDDDAIGWISDITGGADMNDTLFEASVYLMITIGGMLFLVGFFGCCGACKENTCMLTTYAVLVSIFLILQIVAGILALVYRSDIDEEILKGMETSVMQKYGVDDDDLLDKAWDDMQYEWECCGANGHTDYLNNTYITGQGWNVAISCCSGATKDDDNVEISPEDNTACQTAAGGTGDSDLFYSKGCYQSFKDWVEENTAIIAGVFFGLAALELVGVILSCCIKDKINGE